MALHPPISPLTSGQRNCASWASQPQKSVTLLPCRGGRTTKSTRACERAEICKEYFDKLLNTEESKELSQRGNRETNEVEVEELPIEEVKKQRQWKFYKNNKAVGSGGIRPELIKYGGNKLLYRMYEFWEEERIPEEWKETIIVPIHKKEKEIGVRKKRGERIRKCSLQNFGK